MDFSFKVSQLSSQLNNGENDKFGLANDYMIRKRSLDWKTSVYTAVTHKCSMKKLLKSRRGSFEGVFP